MVVLIILNVLLGVVPMLLNIKKVFSTVLEMLLYLLLGCPSYNGMFMVHGITNCVNAIGMSEDKRYHFKSLINTWYVILNTVIGLLILTMTTRKSRVSCVLALSIIFTIYNFIKIGAIIWGRMFVINKHEEISVSDVAQSEIKKWIVKNSDVIEDAQCLDANMNDGNNNNNKGKDEEVVVFGNLDDAIKFKKNNEDDLDVESHNKAFISHQYDDNDSIRGKNSIIEQHQQIMQMQKGSNRSGSGVGKNKSKKSEKKINSKRSGNENEEKNGKDNININVNVSALNMSNKHIGNSLDSNVINEINNNLIGNSSNNDNGNGKEEIIVQKEENKEDNGISESNIHNFNVDDGINKVDVVDDANKSENNEIQQSFHNNNDNGNNGNENIVVVEHDKDKEEEQQQQKQIVKEDDNDIKVSQVHSIKDNTNNENEENNKSKELEPSQINNDNNNNDDVNTFQQEEEQEQQQNQQEEEQAQQVHIQPENTEQPSIPQEEINNNDNNNNIQLQTLDNIISNDNPPIKEEPIDTNEIKIE